MKRQLMTFVTICVFALGTASCFDAVPLDSEKVLGLAGALTKVSATVHTTVRYKNPPPDLMDRELLTLATSHTPKLLDRFDGYVLKARQSGGHSSVLLCDAKGETALVEDAGCTSKSDVHVWETHPGHACVFILNLEETCPMP